MDKKAAEFGDDDFIKISVGRNQVTKVQYQNDPSLSLGGYQGGRSPDGQGSSQFYEKSMEQTLRRRNKTVRQLVSNNFTANSSFFVTLTFDPLKFPFPLELQSGEGVQQQLERIVDHAIKEFRAFIRKVQKHAKGDFRYVAVPEVISNTTSRVNAHFHMIADGAIGLRLIEQLWKSGRVSCDEVYNPFGLAYYMTKTSEIHRCDLLFGRKGYFASTGLLKDQELRAWRREDFRQMQEILEKMEEHEPDRSFTLSNDFAGEVVYTQYYKLDNYSLFDSIIEERQDKEKH